VRHALADDGLDGGADVGKAVEEAAEIFGIEDEKIGRACGSPVSQ
jgi:hypothetical protein